MRADALAVERPPVERPPVEVAPTPAPGEPVVAPRSELPPFILGGLLLIAGLAVGFSMGALAMRALAVQTEPEAAAVLKSPPQLLVRAPDGARLFIDGRELTLSDDGATANLSAGDESRVRVEMDDFPPFEQAFTLDHNELRVLTVEFR